LPWISAKIASFTLPPSFRLSCQPAPAVGLTDIKTSDGLLRFDNGYHRATLLTIAPPATLTDKSNSSIF
jgi:hypothetical protein